MHLQEISHPKVGIVGGGPGGSFAALHFLKLAQEEGFFPHILIFEPRDFDKPGPESCNHCAGILSSRLMKGLKKLDLELPPRIIQSEIHSYALHLNHEVIQISPPDPSRRIASVYRSGGPRLLHGKPLAGLDGYLLTQACLQGAHHIPRRVERITWEGKPIIQTAKEEHKVDLLILATGVNSQAPLSPRFGYQPPKTTFMAQDEIFRPASWPADRVNIYFNQPPELKFGVIIPKDDYLNISLLGKDTNRVSIQEFIHAQELQDELAYSQSNSLCGCNPRIAVGPAHGYYGDRWVAVGDAAVSRLYKDGIGSAFYTAKKAVQVAFNSGISKRAFKSQYEPYCQHIHRDNRFGKWLFSFWEFMLQKPVLLKAWTRALQAEKEQSAKTQAHIRIVWGMFTGDEPYRDLLYLGFRPKALRNLFFPPQ